MSDEIDLNTAAANELASLPGIGATLAERIVAHRDTTGPLQSMTDLLDIAGVTARIVELIAGRVTMGGADKTGQAVGADAPIEGEKNGGGGGGYAGGQGGGHGGEQYGPGDEHGGDPVRIHEAYVAHHLEGGRPASTDTYAQAREQFRRLPGVVQRPAGHLTIQSPDEESDDEDRPKESS